MYPVFGKQRNKYKHSKPDNGQEALHLL